LLPNELKGRKYVALHLRKGDYYDAKETRHLYQRMHSPICFALTACRSLPSQYRSLPLVIVTDDKPHASLLLPLLAEMHPSVIIYSSPNPLIDWSVLHNASFRILANSTFSVTSALLSIHPRQHELCNFLPQWFNSGIHSADVSWDLIPLTLLL